MKANKAVLLSILALALFAFSEWVLASSGNHIVQLSWGSKAEVLEYHSCGAADVCWVAQVKNKKTKKRIAMLRCDGERLFSRVGRNPEAIAGEDCHKFESENKFQEIPATLRALMHR